MVVSERHFIVARVGVDGYLDTPQRQMASRRCRRRQSARTREVSFCADSSGVRAPTPLLLLPLFRLRGTDLLP
jgi:hypothetical protein